MMTQNQVASGILKPFVTSLLISAGVVAPFIVLELVNRRVFREDFPFVLFTFMSLHSLFIALLLMPGHSGEQKSILGGHSPSKPPKQRQPRESC